MQAGCYNLQVLISRYADGEANPAERAQVDAHVAGCIECARKLTEYMEMAALFSTQEVRVPDPYLRHSLFREIDTIREEARHREAIEIESARSNSLQAPGAISTRVRFAARLWQAARPFASAAAALLIFVSALTLIGKPPSTQEPEGLPESSVSLQPVPTIAATIAGSLQEDGRALPPPVQTEIAQAVNVKVASPPAVETVLTVARTTATAILRLAQPVPVLESENGEQGTQWQSVRDPLYGYVAQYPLNWWTEPRGGTRLFYPWTQGGTRYAPYRIEIRVEPNLKGLDATAANTSLFNGAYRTEWGTRHSTPALRRNFNAGGNSYDDFYTFDNNYIYNVRLSVPHVSSLAPYEERWSEADGIFTRLTNRLLLASQEQAGNSAYRQVLFLRGTDLYAVDTETAQKNLLTLGYKVRHWAASPDLQQVAFTSNPESGDPWATDIYLAPVQPGRSTPLLLWSAAKVYDVSWYSNNRLLVIAKGADGFGIYRIDTTSAPLRDASSDGSRADLILALDDKGMAGARGLSVSPDRQLVTFLAPVGEERGTDLYAMRPDGSDLRKLVSHTEHTSPASGNKSTLAPENQAIKSYLWAEGHLEKEGYSYNLLHTSGRSLSPHLYRGGFLYSAPGIGSGLILNPKALDVVEPLAVQIVHLALSPGGKLAFTGYYSDYNGRADQLAGLWTADYKEGALSNLQKQPTPQSPHGITDLQWTPDGESLIYRETMPSNPSLLSATYDGQSPFNMVRLHIGSGRVQLLFDGK